MTNSKSNSEEVEMKNITEEMKIHEQWYKEAQDKDMTLETIPAFLKKLTTEYNHDYGTICHALTAGAIATMWAMNRTPQGGITGFQSGCIMWEFIRNWNGEKGPLRLIKYDEMLFPQYEDKFQKNISMNTWKYLQEEAKKNIDSKEHASLRVIHHWQSIADGIVPFGYAVKED